MSDRLSTESANDFVTATLVIPRDGIRVIAAPPHIVNRGWRSLGLGRYGAVNSHRL